MKPTRYIRLFQRALLISLILTASNIFAEMARLTHNSNLRESSTSSSSIIATLPTGTDLSLISIRKRSGYYHAKLQDGRSGWVLAKNVRVAQPNVVANATPSPGTRGAAFDPGCTLPFEAIKQKHPVIDDTCSIDGEKSGGGTPPASKVAENHAKNNFCLTGTPFEISYQDLLQLEGDTKKIRGPNLPSAAARKTKLGGLLDLNGQKIGEGMLVRITLFVIQGAAEYADIAPKYNGESVNCNRLTPDENDIHIPLGQQATDDEKVSVTVEMSPHYRPAQWTPDRINNVGQHLVRVTGQLFYDSAHRTASGGRTGSPRASLWEIHPVYNFEVCALNDAASCQNAPDSAWTQLDQFQP
jgi:hypothetical protein